MAKIKLGILTGGGDCPGINAVIRGFVKSAKKNLNAEVLGFLDGFLGLTACNYIHLNDGNVSGLLTQGGTILGSNNRFNPFAVESKGGLEDMSEQCMLNYKKLGLSALVCVGGDGTLTIGEKFAQKGLNILGVPKTIDNDIVNTDVTFGFNSALTTATEAIDKIHTTAASHHRIMLVEVMGRNAGWLALYSGIASGADIILMPEFPFNYQAIIEAIESREKRGKRFSIIVVAEGVREKGKSQFYIEHKIKGKTIKRLGGASNAIAQRLEEEGGYECRVAVLGHLQRGGVPTAYDRILATSFAVTAVEFILRKKFNVMVALQNNNMVAVPLKEISGKQKLVPKDFSLINKALSIETSLGC